mgnify:CR=1 FL=1
MLYFWLFESQEVSHPIGMLVEKLQTDPALLAEVERMQPDWQRLKRRGIKLVATLIDVPLNGPEDIMPALRELAARSRTNHGST